MVKVRYRTIVCVMFGSVLGFIEGISPPNEIRWVCSRAHTPPKEEGVHTHLLDINIFKKLVLQIVTIHHSAITLLVFPASKNGF